MLLDVDLGEEPLPAESWSSVLDGNIYIEGELQILPQKSNYTSKVMYIYL